MSLQAYALSPDLRLSTASLRPACLPLSIFNGSPYSQVFGSQFCPLIHLGRRGSRAASCPTRSASRRNISEYTPLAGALVALFSFLPPFAPFWPSRPSALGRSPVPSSRLRSGSMTLKSLIFLLRCRTNFWPQLCYISSLSECQWFLCW